MTTRSLDEGSWRLDTFVVPEGALEGTDVVLEGPEHRHAFGSVRVRVGHDVRLIDGAGVEALATVESVGRCSASLQVVETRAHRRDDGASLTIVQAIPKGKGMDAVVRRCAELGVDTIVPVVTARSVSRPSETSAGERLERWRALALAAVKQSRGVYITNVEPPTTIAEVGDVLQAAERSVVAWEEECGTSLVSALERQPRPRSLAAVVGPEGGFTPEEIEAMTALGVEPVGLGRRILRSDWAAAALAAVASQVLGGLLP